MKRLLCVALYAVMCILASSAFAEPHDDYVYATVIDKLSTRNGPGTHYMDTGTYKLKGQRIKLLSYYYDANDVCWLEIEIRYHDRLRRLYTGLKRFDPYTVDFDLLAPHKIEYEERTPATVIKTSKGKYGPGEEYGTYSNLLVEAGTEVSVTENQNGWYEAHFIDDGGVSQMCWVKADALWIKEVEYE